MAKIKLSPLAVSDLNEIKTYISEELCDPIAADRIVRNIVNDYSLLEISPFMGASLSAIIPVKNDYRYVVSGKYIIIYSVNKKTRTVDIEYIAYSRRDLGNVWT